MSTTPSSSLVALGQTLREARELASYSLRELGIQIGYSATHLSRVERGTEHPSRNLLKALAKELSLDLTPLLLQAGHLPQRVEDYLLSHPDAVRAVEVACDWRLTGREFLMTVLRDNLRHMPPEMVERLREECRAKASQADLEGTLGSSQEPTVFVPSARSVSALSKAVSRCSGCMTPVVGRVLCPSCEDRVSKKFFPTEGADG